MWVADLVLNWIKPETETNHSKSPRRLGGQLRGSHQSISDQEVCGVQETRDCAGQKKLQLFKDRGGLFPA